MRIAYLEDDADQATLIRKWLEEAGHICHYFDRGHALQRSLARESFDNRTAGITEPEQLCNFVECLSSRIIASASYDLVLAWFRNKEDVCVTPGDNQCFSRVLDRWVFKRH